MDSPSTIRAFVGLPLVEPARGQVRQAQRRLAGRLPNPNLVRWEREANLHGTLFFLGDTPENLVTPLVEGLEEQVRDHLAFRLELGHITTFGGNRPRLFAATTDRGTDELKALHQSVVDAVLPLGFTAETRPYRPHFTIGRVRRRQRLSPVVAARVLEPVAQSICGASMEVNEVVLFRSQLSATGATYHRLAGLALTAPPR
jgi:2'-5' RNA ligase